MKKTSFRLILWGLFSLLWISIFIASCTKTEMTPVEVPTMSNDIQEIHINDPDVQEFISIREQLYSLFRNSDNTVFEAENLTTENILNNLQVREAVLIGYYDRLESTHVNIASKYPYLELENKEFQHFFTSMNRLFPEEGQLRDDLQDCRDNCVVEKFAIITFLTLNGVPYLAAQAIGNAYLACCVYNCEQEHGAGSGSGSGSAAPCQPVVPGTGTGSGTGNGGTCYECYNGIVVSIVHVDETLCNYLWSDDSVTLNGPCPGSGSGSGSGTGTGSGSGSGTGTGTGSGSGSGPGGN